ncbi:MAG: glycosyltransferase family 4 protein [Halobacteriota archaeon]|nr:glycosyltransferase family 4 protein [Halobacteriota archaeon]
MKIAFVYDAVYPYIKGGAEKRIYEVSKRLVKRGHEVHLFGVKWWDGEDVIKRDEISLHGVCKVKGLYTGDGRRSIKEALYFALKVFIPLLREDFDVVDVSEFPYFSCFSVKAASLLKRAPMIITWHEVWGDYWYDYLGAGGGAGRLVEKAAARLLTDRIIAVSEKTKEDLISIGVSELNINVVPNGINSGEIEGVPGSEDNLDVIYVGRLIKDKNTDILIRAIDLVRSEIPGVRCGVIGDGPERERLEDLVRELGVEENIKFLGFFEDYEDVITQMKASKVFVLPSTREGFGIVVLEANACGLPVVTTDDKGNAAKYLIINGENGFKGALTEEFISEKIVLLLKDEKLRVHMHEKSMVFSQEYDWGGIVDELEGMYKEVIS